jgi:hypothetical protein
LAACTASMERVRMVLMTRRSGSDDLAGMELSLQGPNESGCPVSRLSTKVKHGAQPCLGRPG